MEQLIGANLGKYEIVSEIGRGGMGTVYKAYDPALDRHVAIKVLAPHLTWEKDFVDRFLREARLAARLRHPNMVTIHDVGQEGEWYYIVMEYLEGQPLSEVLKDKVILQAEKVISLLVQIAQALDIAHQGELVHRDIKPANIIISPRGQATLTDFGIAKAADEIQLTATGMVVGTPAYMAPEQVTTGEVGAWTDIYALAVVAYEMLAGQPPFKGENTPAVLHKVVYEEIPPIDEFRPDLPPEVQDVLHKALSKNPEGRFLDGLSFVQALAEALGCEIVVSESSVMEEGGATQKGVARLPVWVWAALAVAVIVVVFSVLWGAGVFEPEVIPTITPRPNPTETGTPTVSPSPGPTVTPTALSYAQAVSGTISLYAGPGFDYQEVGQLDDQVLVVGWVRNSQGQIWLLIRLPEGGHGWILADANVVIDTEVAKLPAVATIPPTLRPGETLSTSTPTRTPRPTSSPRSTTSPVPGNHAPEVYNLSCGVVSLRIGERAVCTCQASDPDADPIYYSWYLDGVWQSGEESYQYTFIARDVGKHTIRALVRDARGAETDSEWTVSVIASAPTATPTHTPRPTLPTATDTPPPTVPTTTPSETPIPTVPTPTDTAYPTIPTPAPTEPTATDTLSKLP